MIGQILAAFQGFFSRAFWFGSFLPVAVVAAVHFTLIEVVFPGTLPIQEWLDAPTGQLTKFALVISVLVVIAYSLSSLVPLIREFLDGRLLSDRLHFALRRERVVGWHKDINAIRSASRLYGALDSIGRREPQRWAAARSAGLARAEAVDQAAIDSASREISRFRWVMRLAGIPSESAVQIACDALTAALSNNAASLPATTRDRRQLRRARRLTQLHAELELLLEDAASDARYRFRRFNEMASPLDVDKFQATRVGDARWLSERYSEDAYHVSYEFLWPRMHLALGDEAKGFAQRLGDAQSQIEFSVLALVLTLTVPMIWLPLLLMTEHTPWLFLCIGIATPFVLRFFYEMIVQSQIAYGRIARGVVDHYRLQLLTATLHVPMPSTLSAERALWEKLQQMERGEASFDLVYERGRGAAP